MAENIEFKLKVVENKLDAALDSATKKTFTLAGALESAVGNFTANVATKGFEILGDAIGSATDFLFDSVDAAAESESAFNRLKVALSQTGQLTDENVKNFKALADEIQRTTAFEDDAVISAGALLQTLGRLSGDGLIKATQAATDLSAALGIDLESAATLVGKAANGNITAFGKLGVEIRKGSTDAETFANTLKTLNDRFGGSATAQVNTFSGALAQIKNIYGDLQETIGGLITQSPSLIAAFNTVKTILIQVGDSIKNAFAGGEAEDSIKRFFDGFILGAKIAADALDGISRAVQAVFNIAQTTINGFLTIYSGGIALVLAGAERIPVIGDKFKGAAEVAQTAFETFKESTIENFDEIGTSLTEGNVFTSISDGITAADNTFNAFYNNVKGKSEELKNSGGISGGASPEELAKQQQIQDEISNIQAQGLIEQASFKEQFEIANREAEGVRRAEDIIKLAEFEQQKIDLALQAEIQKNNLTLQGRERDLANQKAIELAKLNSQKLNNKAIIDSQKFQAQQEQQIQASRIQALQGFLSAGLTLAKQGSKEAKAIQTASAIVSTYTAANQALSSPPGPPFTLPLVAATIAQGLANVARINSQSFATGGVVGATRGGDNTTANVRTGEMILNADQQKNLFDAINSGGFNSGDIVIKIDEREIARAIRNQRQGGFEI